MGTDRAMALARASVNFMGAGVLGGAVAAYAAPGLFSWIAPWTSPLLGFIMFGMGVTLRFEDFRRLFRHPRDIALGAVLQFTVMPALAYLLARSFNLDPELALGVILVGAAPGGTASNVLTYLARGDVPLSISMTLVSTCCAVFLTPFITWALGGVWASVAPWEMLKSIFWVVAFPVAAGLFVHHAFEHATQRLAVAMPFVSSLAIIGVVSGIIAANATAIRSAGLALYGVIILHNLGGLGIGYGVAWGLGLPAPKCRALSLEVGTQNSGLATALAYTHFSATAAVMGALFSVWQNISGSLFAAWCRRGEERQEKAMASPQSR